MKEFTIPFNKLNISKIAEVGGKNASLGEMVSKLSAMGIKVPEGFATSSGAFETFLQFNQLLIPLDELLNTLDRENFSNLRTIGSTAREMILKASLPAELENEIFKRYLELGAGQICDVAVRSSATTEDLPDASFAGQHESYLNIRGRKQLMDAVVRCYASLYTDRAIKYREDKGFNHKKIAISVGVQKMVRSDKGCSGVAFTLEPESGFRDIIHINGAWGLGENIVQGTVTPDEFMVFKTTLRNGKDAIIRRKLGSKLKMMVYGSDNDTGPLVENIDTPLEQQQQFVLNDNEIRTLAGFCMIIEDHYAKPMDIEWAKDGITNEIFIIQARPETVHSLQTKLQITEYKITEKKQVLVKGEAIGNKVATGFARVLSSPKEAGKLTEGDIVITDLTSPDWDPMLKKAGAIVTNKGGRTSHASIVARELGVPAIVGANNATEIIKDGTMITVSCCEGKTGYVYEGKAGFIKNEIDFGKILMPETVDPMLIIADPEKAFQLSFYPNKGVGLMRMEFIITHFVKVHPMALLKYDSLKDLSAKQAIDQLSKNYPDKESYFVDMLSQGIATIGSAFFPKDVIVRMSDFKTNEYANLIGGKEFEPVEENPMLGFRGASRYYHPLYKEGFHMECAAIKKVRNEMGLTNIKVMIPFCRTAGEGKKVVETMQEFGLDREKDPGLEMYVMAELPSNVLDAEEFAKIFDGFSIGSNDLTQLVLGIDRDSAIIPGLFDERNPAVLRLISEMIDKAHQTGKKIGLCGQAPSDYPEFAKFLVERGIDSISFNPDALLKGIENINHTEAQLATSLAK
jgi:pyruvate,water dikinase